MSPCLCCQKLEHRVKEDLQEITAVEEPEIKLADTWQKTHGEDDWVAMLDPFNPLLRSELTRYGKRLKLVMMHLILIHSPSIVTVVNIVLASFSSLLA
ncbi:hypothetical protein CRYUN_Cryun10bG0038400 [Craigia yunnanensis]